MWLCGSPRRRGAARAPRRRAAPRADEPRSARRLDQRLDVALVGEEAVLHGQRRARVGPVSRTRPCERGFITKTAALISQPGSTAGNRKRSPAPAHRHLRHEHRPRRPKASVSRCSRSVGSQAIPTPTWSISPSPTGRSCASRARSRSAAGSPASRTRRRRARSLSRVVRAGSCSEPRLDPVDERVGEDRQVRSPASRVEIGEGGVPAHGADAVHRVHDRAPPAPGERAVPGRELVGGERARAASARRAPGTARAPRAPAVAPLVVVGGAPAEHDARVVRRAAAEDAGAQLRAVLAVGLPGVRERERAAVEHVVGPAAAGVGPVVGARLDQADGALRVLAQPRREHAPGRAAARDDDVEAPHRRIISRRGSKCK